MPLQLGGTVPDFTQASSAGEISVYDRAGDGWGVLFSHPADFTPLCTTELDLLYAALLSVQSDLPAELVEETASAIAEAYDARLSASKQGCISCGYGREARTLAYSDARSALDAFLGG